MSLINNLQAERSVALISTAVQTSKGGMRLRDFVVHHRSQSLRPRSLSMSVGLVTGLWNAKLPE